ncbi:MAG: NAD(P)H-hydrate dehydratase [Thaumarchaeota archaeon]|nr:NAD(P)H-hydrate dehydratase [Nitrososphaerota archaeon]
MKQIVIDEAFVAAVVPARKASSHKRMNGTVCVVGGSRLYHGAPYLSAMGAMRSGVDLVYVAVPAPIASPLRSLSPDLIVVPLPDGKLTRGSVSKLLSWVRDVDCFALGPGLGPQKPEWVAVAASQLRTAGKSLVVDADALRPETLGAIENSGTVVTPHAKEFERLFGEALPKGSAERMESARSNAAKHKVTVLLKGPTDIITDGERVALNETHSPAMTVGGTGDVLTGVTAGLLAKSVPPFEAACAAAFINGSAGAEAARHLGLHITASDVVNQIATVMKRFDRLE